MVAVRAPAAQFCTSAWLTKALSALPSNSNLQSSASCRRGSGRLDWAKSWRYLEEKQDTPLVEVDFERYSRGCVALSNLLNLYRLTCATQKWGCSKQLAYVSELKPAPAAMDENMMKLRRANGLNICGVVASEVLRMLQRLRIELCSDQSDVCILKKLRKGTWLFQVISVSLGTHGTQRNEKCLIQFFQLSGSRTHRKKRGTA